MPKPDEDDDDDQDDNDRDNGQNDLRAAVEKTLLIEGSVWGSYPA